MKLSTCVVSLGLLAAACSNPAEPPAGGATGGTSGAFAGAFPTGGTAPGGASSGGATATGGVSGSATGGAAPQGGVGPLGGAGGNGGTPSSGGSGGSASGFGGGGIGGAGAAAGAGGTAGAPGGRGGAGGVGGAAGTGGSGGAGAGGSGGADPNFYVFLLIGQSNMEGTPQPQAQDRETNPRVKVLAYDNCSGLGRTYNQWYTASPPLHSCGLGVGPGDYFAKTLAAQYPEKTIGLVPCAIAGVDIAFFQKGVTSTRRNEFRIPPDNHWGGAYEWVIERARLAQRSGVIKGILFHQGESDNGQSAWVGKVRGMVTDLRTDLGLGNVPFLAGELLYSGCCSAHNPVVAQLPGQLTNAHVISASGLAGMDQYHFDLAGQRTLGARYGNKMIEVGNL
jgi:hypothetical protein